MASSIVCDNCGATLLLKSNGDDENGEVAAWPKVVLRSGEEWDACTRSCAAELLGNDGPVRPVLDAWAAAISEIARTIRDADEPQED